VRTTRFWNIHQIRSHSKI